MIYVIFCLIAIGLCSYVCPLIQYELAKKIYSKNRNDVFAKTLFNEHLN